VLRAVRAERADMISAWRRGLFCALGDGDVDLEAFCAELAASGYDGWVVIEQDRVLEDGGAFTHASAEQHRNRAWLRDHAGW
jgi:inosose dehydratase